MQRQPELSIAHNVQHFCSPAGAATMIDQAENNAGHKILGLIVSCVSQLVRRRVEHRVQTLGI
jgi:hypothetical protein